MPSNLRFLRDDATGIVVDLQRAPVPSDLSFGPPLAALVALESGATANVTEQRRVGHYWLRDPDRAPSPDLSEAIRESWKAIAAVDATGLDTVLLVGIGGSALGPALAIEALGAPSGRRLVLLDTVDPEGVKKILSTVTLERTLVIVASKSGSTTETMTAMRIVEAAFAAADVPFAPHAVAVTTPGSTLAELAKDWRAVLPIWSWVGGRTSITSAVGLLPMHLCGLDIRAFLDGARAMDEWTRQAPESNPAAQLAALWAAEDVHTAALFPYVDALRSLGRYTQQLVMESLGKESNRQGETVRTGLTVIGNKGSADQHALIQQLRDGPLGVACHFVSVEATPQPTELLDDAADLQFALMTGTQHALSEVGQVVVSIRVPVLNEAALGALIALLERTVSLTAEFLDINAYDQPGVEAGKIEARAQLSTMKHIAQELSEVPLTARELATSLGLDAASAWRICHHLSGQGKATLIPGKTPSDDRFRAV